VILTTSAQVLAVRWLARTALLLFWSLAAWGALLLLVTLVGAVGEGVGPPLARLFPVGGASLWAWLNALSAGLAIAVGLVGGAVAWTSRHGAPPPPPAS
jgi:hypothetical protein